MRTGLRNAWGDESDRSCRSAFTGASTTCDNWRSSQSAIISLSNGSAFNLKEMASAGAKRSAGMNQSTLVFRQFSFD